VYTAFSIRNGFYSNIHVNYQKLNSRLYSYQSSNSKYRKPDDFGTVDSGTIPENNLLMNKPTIANNTIQSVSRVKMLPLNIFKLKNTQNITATEPGWIIKTGKRYSSSGI